MAESTGISYADHSLNFWVGCSHVSDGCRNCYMFAEMRAYRKKPENIARTSDANWKKAAKYSRLALTSAQEHEHICFANSWSDFFHEAGDAWRLDAWRVIRENTLLTWLIITKRPERITACLPDDWGPRGYRHVLLGVTVEHYNYLPRLNHLYAVPAAGYVISVEPMLSYVVLPEHRLTDPRLRGIVAGGETGVGNIRPTHPEWARHLRDQAARAGVPFHWKSWGEWLPANQRGNSDVAVPAGSKPPAAGLALDGELYSDKPSNWPQYTATVFRVSKQASGRMLDGACHDARPSLAPTPAPPMTLLEVPPCPKA